MEGRGGGRGGGGWEEESGGEEEEGREERERRRRRSLGEMPWQEREGGGERGGERDRGRRSMKGGGGGGAGAGAGAGGREKQQGSAGGRLRWDEIFDTDRAHHDRGSHLSSDRRRGGSRAREPELMGSALPLRGGQVGASLSEISKTIGKATHAQLSASFKLHGAEMLSRLLRLKRRWTRAFAALRRLEHGMRRARVLRKAAACLETRQQRRTQSSVFHRWQMLSVVRREGVRRIAAVRMRGEQRRLLLVAVGTWIRTRDWVRAAKE
eukprot:1598540-Rhodomonas_salina.1